MIKPIGASSPLGKPTTKAINQAVQETKKKVGCINSYEFHLGFVPTHKPGSQRIDQAKVEHFIDQLI